jgi:PAS domain S-box-containing protein
MATKNEQITELETGQTAAEILYQISRDLNMARDEHELLRLLDQPARKRGASSSNLLYIDLDERGQPEWAEVVAFWYREGIPPIKVGTRYYLPEFSFTPLFLSSPNEPLLIPDAAADETIDKNTRVLLAQLHMRATAIVPLTQTRLDRETPVPDSTPDSTDRRWVGLIILNWDEVHEFTEREVEIYNALIGLASPAVENRRLVTNLEQIIEERTGEVAIFRALAENATDAVFMASMKGKITYANRTGYELFGYEYEQQALIGKGIEDLTSKEEQELLTQKILPLVRKTGSWRGELKQKRQDGSCFDTYMTIFIIQDKNGQPMAQTAIIRNITEQKQAEAERERLQQEVIEAQRQTLKELSTPVIPVMDRIIVMPLIGSVDSIRAIDITRSLLAGISQHRAKVVILDVTGVPIVDSGVANHLNKTIQAARLKGARTIVTGISDAVAETIVDLGIDWGDVETLSDLRTGLIVALNRMGIKLSG